MRTWFQGLITGTALAFSIAVSHAQFVAFNDHAPGSGTAPNTTTWNVEGQPPGRTGALKNINTGADLPVILTITVSGNVTFEGSQGNPSPGTPLYNVFNGFVDFSGTPNPSLALNGAGAVVTYTFTGLDPNKRYSFKGSAVRAGGYADRWTTFQLDGADAFTSSHTANALTSAQVPAILANQVVINTGINDTPTTGDMASWDNIEPGADGSFSVSSLQYQGTIPNGGSSGGAKGYGMTGLRLEEFNVTPQAPAITGQPQNVTTGELQPATFSITATGNPRPGYQWFKNDVGITDATNSSYTIAAAALSDNGARFKAAAINVTNNVTNTVISGNAVLTVIADTNRPVLLRVATVSEISVLVTFSEPVSDATGTNVANYAITSSKGALTISNAVIQASGSNVVLNTSLQAAGVTYTVTVNGIQDRSAAGNQIAANSSATFSTVSGYQPADIGAPGTAGSVTPGGNGFDVTASGADVGGTSDQFTLGYQQRTGDFDVRVRLQGLRLADAWSKAGLMARQSLNANSTYAATLATPSVSGCFFQSRTTTGTASVSSGTAPVNYPDTWLRLRRSGNSFSGFASFDGITWVQLGSATVVMSDPIYFGLAVSSHTTGTVTTAQFRDIGTATSPVLVNSLPLASEPLGPSSRRTGLAISEIMYHPTNADAEFVEIYNSQGFWEKIGGYRLSGDIDYTFPADTIIPSGGFIVVAKDPALIQSLYGLGANVLGPFDGSLPNDKGTVRLRNRQNAILLEVKYDTKYPWPIAPDGAGPSLVLARATYGEGNPRAWAASDQVGGSPGAPDPIAGAGRTVLINEILAHTENPAVPDFVELYNHGNQPVDLSGALITDGDTNSFRISNGTIIPANGFLSFDQNQLEFAFKAAGDRVFLISSNQTRVLDAVRFGAQADGVSIGRLPDGAETFRELALPTPGARNGSAGRKARDIVINELMYSPISGNSSDQYVELYNKGTNSIDLGGWKFVAGIDFTFPSNSVVPAGGYFVVAKNQTNLLAHYGNLNSGNTVGDYSGTLSGGGERVALAKPEPVTGTDGLGQPVTNIIYVVINEVTYGDGGRWGHWANGGGSSLELVDPRSDNSQAANWADSDETAKSQWTNFEFTGGIGETLGSPINDNLQIFMLGIGECLIDEVELHNGNGTNLVLNSGFENGTNFWALQGSHDFSSIENVGYAGTKSLHIRAGSRGDNGANRIRSAPLAASGTVTLRAKARWLKGWPEVLLRVHGGGAEVTGRLPLPTNLGTPGAPNSRLVANAGPAIYDVSHSPVLPAASELVVVKAKVSDPDGLSRVTLRYRVDPFTGYGQVNMLDNGTGGDAVAGDGIYSAIIPAQAAFNVVAFYIEAVDTAGGTNLFPQDVFPPAGLTRVFPNDSPTRECVIRWGDVQMPGSFATYHLWLTTTASNRWATRDPLNNAEMDGTFVYNNSRVVYNALPLYAGSPWHRGQMTTGPGGINRVDYVMNFPSDDRMLGQTDFVLNNPGNPGGTSTSDTAAQSEQTSYIIFNELGIHYNYRRYIHYFINGSQRSTTSNRSGNFIFEDSQQPNGDQVNEWHSDDPDGQLFKIEDWFEFNDNGYDFSNNNDADLIRRLIPGTAQLSTSQYRFMWRRRSVGPGESASDYSKIFSMVDAASPPADPNGALNFAAFDGIADWEQWMRIFACQRTCGNWDSYGWQRGKNDYCYKGVNGKFQQMTWDIDFTMGVGGNAATDPLTGGESDPRVIAMKNDPTIRRAYWRAFSDIINGPLNNSFMDPILDAKAAAMAANNVNYDPATVTIIKTYVRDRHNFIQSQLATVQAPFAISGNTVFSTSNNLVTLSGTAPVEVKTITINGIEYPVKWTTVNGWTITFAIGAGINVVNVQGIDLKGNPMAANVATANITYTGSQVDPRDALVINEMMYNPAVSNAAYIEIYNSSSTFAFDLSNWRLSGLNYTFPQGTIITNKQFIVIAKDRTVFAATYGSSIPVLGEFDGNFDPDGEKIALIKPGASSDQDQVIDIVRYEAVAPWPSTANGGGAALQLIDSSQDHTRVSNWGDGSGWRFHSFTATPGIGASSFTITLDTAGDFYIDDVTLVAGTVAGAGPNLLQNGGFESGSLGPWTASGTHAGSAVSTAVKFSGNASLHVVATAPGSVPASAIAQSVTNANIISSNTYTLSFWYLPTTNATGFNYRLTSSLRSFSSINLRPSLASPGAPNTSTAILEAYPLVWINEIEPNNVSGILDGASEHDPWIELYNSGTNAITLDGYALANNYTNLGQWPFPNGIVINAGEFKVLFADGQTGQTLPNELHTNFRLDGANGSVVLSKNGRILDYINYSDMQPDFSYGSYPDAQVIDRQRFFYTTPGARNNGSPVPVIINEWLASNTNNLVDPATGKYEDWIELYNFGPVAIDLSGFYLTDDLGKKKQWALPAGTIIGPGAYMLVWADNAATNSTPTDLHASFALSKNGEQLGLFTPDGLTVDALTFGPQQNNISQGRYPDGNFAGVLHFMTTPTPRGANVVPVNQFPPILPTLGNRTINEGSLLSFTVLATDNDSPVQTLTYTMDPGTPAGATLDRFTGVFRWTPSEAQGGAIYNFTIRVSDNGSPTYTDSKAFSVTVNKVNSPPIVQPLVPQTLPENSTVSFTVSASDSDLPVQSLTFSLDAGAPTGATIDAVTGLFSWTPDESQGPSTNAIVVRVTDNGVPSASATQIVVITVTEVNSRPVLVNPGTLTFDESKLNSFTLTATDADLPTNRLTFATVAPFISGLTINSGSGTLNWTPTEAQGPSNYLATVRVSDNGVPSLSSTQSFTIIVREVNVAPVLNNLSNTVWTINELTPITLTNKATDVDLPANILTYEIVSAPAGATVNASSGIFNWTPTEAQGPSSNSILVRVFDDGSPSLSATQRFSVVVNEVNSPPVLSPIGNKTVAAGQLLTVNSVANDPDLPPQILTFSLGAGAPTGANLDASSGVFTWTPGNAQSPSTNIVTIQVADNGTPSLSATQTFTIFVNSSLHISEIRKVDATHLSIICETQSGKNYQVEYLDELDQAPNWQALSGSQVTATGTSQNFPITIGSGSHRFYRIAQTN